MTGSTPGATHSVVIAFEFGPTGDGFDPQAFADRAALGVQATLPPGTPVGIVDVAVRALAAGEASVIAGAGP